MHQVLDRSPYHCGVAIQLVSQQRKHTMNIRLTELPSPTKLIVAMDRHRFGATMFVVASSILSAAAVASLWIYFYFKH